MTKLSTQALLRRAASSVIETLEDRRLLASISYVDGGIVVEPDNRVLTSGLDVTVDRVSASDVRVDATENGELVRRYFNLNFINGFTFGGTEQTDTLAVDASITLPTFSNQFENVLGGGGMDTVVGSIFGATVNGRGGNDVISVQGNSTVIASAGTDSIIFSQGGSPGTSGDALFDLSAISDDLTLEFEDEDNNLSSGTVSGGGFSANFAYAGFTERTFTVQLGSGDDAATYTGSGDEFAQSITLRGGPGNDTLVGGPSPDQLFGEAGDDDLDGGPTPGPTASRDTLDGGAGFDRGVNGDVLISIEDDGTGGSDPVRLEGRTLVITGTDQNDQLTTRTSGNTFTATLNGQAFDFDTADFDSVTVDGLAGDDNLDLFGLTTASAVVQGGAGQDRTFVNDDTVLGSSGSDVLFATDNSVLDLTAFDSGVNVRFESGGQFGSSGVRVLSSDLGGLRFDSSAIGTILLGDGNDVVDLDRTFGFVNPVTVFGGGGNDTLFGTPGDDAFYGEGGDDSLIGGDGNDLLDGGSGFDNGREGETLVSIERDSSDDQRVVIDRTDESITLTATDANERITTDSDGVSLIVNYFNLDTGLSRRFELGANTIINVRGGDGDDRLEDKTFQFVNLFGEAGNDTLVTFSSGFMSGGDGDDEIDLTPGQTFSGTVDPGNGRNTVFFTAGNPSYVAPTTNEEQTLHFDTISEPVDMQSFTANADGSFVFAGGANITGDVPANANYIFNNDPTNFDASASTDDARRVVQTGSGDDTLVGGLGTDSFFGGEGNDTFDGGPGIDFADGGPGFDTSRNVENTLNVEDDGSGGGEPVIEYRNGGVFVGGTGSDDVANVRDTGDSIRVQLGDLVRYFNRSFVNAVTFEMAGGDDTVDASGTSLDTVQRGFAGDDTLVGGTGLDTLDGGAGTDTGTNGETLISIEDDGSGGGGGSGGDDRDPVIEYRDGGVYVGGTGSADVATVRDTGDSIRVQLGDLVRYFNRNFVNAVTFDMFGGDDNVNAAGTVLDTIQLGGEGNDTLVGGSGSDTLNGGGGTDTGQFGETLISIENVL